MLDVTLAVPTKQDGQSHPEKTVVEIFADSVYWTCGEKELVYDKEDFIDLVQAMVNLNLLSEK